MADLLVIVPTRGRPGNVERVLAAWGETGAWPWADLMLAVDADDPEIERYRGIGAKHAASGAVSVFEVPQQQPMVTTLNAAAVASADDYPMLGFAGDDNLPRSHGWAGQIVAALRTLGTGIVYPDDLVQRWRLPTQWAMTSDIVRALGAMVPSDVLHLYADNTIACLGEAAGCIRYLPYVVIEHCHPIAGTAEMDDGYRRVNAPERYADDRARWLRWVAGRCDEDAAAVRALRETGVSHDILRGATVGGHIGAGAAADPCDQPEPAGAAPGPVTAGG